MSDWADDPTPMTTIDAPGITPRLAALRDGVDQGSSRSATRRAERIQSMQRELVDAMELAEDLESIRLDVHPNPLVHNPASITVARALLAEASTKARRHAEQLRCDLAVLSEHS